MFFSAYSCVFGTANARPLNEATLAPQGSDREASDAVSQATRARKADKRGRWSGALWGGLVTLPVGPVQPECAPRPNLGVPRQAQRLGERLHHRAQQIGTGLRELPLQPAGDMDNWDLRPSRGSFS